MGSPVLALLLVLYPGDIEPRHETPEPIPYAECIEMATRVARYFDHTGQYMWVGPPIVFCEVTT